LVNASLIEDMVVQAHPSDLGNATNEQGGETEKYQFFYKMLILHDRDTM
jgi:hypothetical protein